MSNYLYEERLPETTDQTSVFLDSPEGYDKELIQSQAGMQGLDEQLPTQRKAARESYPVPSFSLPCLLKRLPVTEPKQIIHGT